MTLCNLLRRLRRGDDGVALIEFALSLPVLILLSLVTFEVSNYAMLNIKLQHAADSMAQLATMDEQLPATVLDGMFSSVDQIVQPYDFTDSGVAIVSGVGEPKAGDGAQVNWQRVGAGNLSAGSEVGTPGGAASVPEDLPISPTQALVVAEVVYEYQPILLGFVPHATLRKAAYYRPRYGTLPSLS